MLSPAETLKLAPEIGRHPTAKVWVYRYRHATEPWTLSIATHAQPESRMLSLGGFRIAPESRTSIPGWNSDHEAIDLAIGMDEKVYWSRLLKVGGPHVQRDFSRIVGGKCVMHPTPGSRVGEPRDRELLDFAIECFTDVEKTGFFLTTGQDLGHGVMSDGVTGSLHYLNRQYKGSVISDTGAPTAEGNYWMLVGQLKGAGIPLKGAVVGVIGAGNIGAHIIDHLLADGATPLVVEAKPAIRAALEARGVRCWPADAKQAFLAEPMDALVLNAAGGSLDSATVARCAENPRLRVITGSENLVMPNPDDDDVLRRAQKVFCPCECAGMMGYLTAAEEYLSHLAGVEFTVATMYEAAKALEGPGERATRHVIEGGYRQTMTQAMQELFG
ncbi:MAG: hypothetical protein HYV19_12185 [Gemmatimonadetes bacterium]|nr:hypothetical protein [Gemmatimonadota bacterium]